MDRVEGVVPIFHIKFPKTNIALFRQLWSTRVPFDSGFVFLDHDLSSLCGGVELLPTPIFEPSGPLLNVKRPNWYHSLKSAQNKSKAAYQTISCAWCIGGRSRNQSSPLYKIMLQGV